MSDALPAFDPDTAGPFLLKSGHVGWLGMRYAGHGPDWVELELPWREDLIGESEVEVLASGPIISMMDMAGGMAIWTRHGVFRPVATLDLRVDYQRPARPRSKVIGRAECYASTRSAAFVRGIAHDGDPADPVAHVAAVFMTINAPGNLERRIGDR